jgi:hypothetical protein
MQQKQQPQQDVSLEDDTDNELFASFSSCSSKFKNSQNILSNSINSNLNQLATVSTAEISTQPPAQPQSRNTNSKGTSSQTPPSPLIHVEKSLIKSDEPAECVSTSSSASLIVNAPSSDSEKRPNDAQKVSKESHVSSQHKPAKLTTHASLSTNSKLKLKQLLTESVENNLAVDSEKAALRRPDTLESISKDKIKISEKSQKAAQSPTTSLPQGLIKNVTTRSKLNKESDSSSGNRHSAIYSSASNLSQSAPQPQQIAQLQQPVNSNLQRPSKLSRHNITSASFNCKRKFAIAINF